MGTVVPARARCTLPEARVLELREQLHNPLRDTLRALNPLVREVHIVSLEQGLEDGGGDPLGAIRNFGSRAVPHILPVLGEVRHLGVTWGRTVQAVAEGLKERVRRSADRTSPIDFVPMCGDPTINVLGDARRSSAHIVADLHEHFNGRSTAPRSLVGVAAYIPEEFAVGRAPEIIESIRDFLASSASYRDIFGNKLRKGVVDDLDAVLTSVGPALPGDPWFKAAALNGTAQRLLARLSAGNIGGVFLPRRGVKGTHSHIEDMNKRWTGCRIEHFHNCAQNAGTSPSRVGVVVVAIGEEKAEVVETCVRMGLVNQLIVDQGLARALRKRVATALPSPGP